MNAGIPIFTEVKTAGPIVGIVPFFLIYLFLSHVLLRIISSHFLVFMTFDELGFHLYYNF